MDSDNRQFNQQPTPPQPTYGPVHYADEASWPHMTLADWLVTMLLMMIPIANIVLMFVWAFGSNVNPSKKNFFRASLIMSLIGIVLSFIFMGAITAFIFSGLDMLY